MLTRILLSFSLIGLSACVSVPSEQTPRVAPVVIAANPLAADAGMKILERGGTAVDAAVAVQATLGLVEPQSSGIGGGAFMVYYDAETGKVTQYNGRETAPKAANGDWFLQDNGTPLPFVDAMLSGRSTGVPGVMLMLEKAQSAHGGLLWKDLFDTPVKLTEDGFAISPRLGDYLTQTRLPQNNAADLKAYFADGQGGLKKTGDILKNPAYATTLRQLANKGAVIFREGPLVDAIIARTSEGTPAGALTQNDFKSYFPKSDEALCETYRVYIICVPLPPSSAPSLLQALKIAERFPMADYGPSDPRGWQIIIEAQRLMYADRDQYMADPEFVSVPLKGLLDPAYVSIRAATITPNKASPTPTYGQPSNAIAWAEDKTMEPAGTSHFVIRDRYGNAVSVTTSVESYFGSGRMVGGFFLNNQLTDFSFAPTDKDGHKAANAVEGGKRPRSSMSPVMIFDQDKKLIGMVGSPGGSSILAYNFKALIGVLDWGLSMPEAVALPNVVARGDTIRIEAALMPANVTQSLKDMGYDIQEVAGENSGLHGVMFYPDRIDGGADPRREGVVLIGK
ncbi:MAG: gamma-glutamyltransferase [Asticcacaulis sp.]